jgi:hypothetical protein
MHGDDIYLQILKRTKSFEARGGAVVEALR